MTISRTNCSKSCTIHQRGHVSETAILIIATALNLSRAEVHGVVTFYHDFRRDPAGKHVVKICRAEACQSMGTEALCRHAEQKLRAKTAKRPPMVYFTVEAGLLSRQLRTLPRRDDR